MGKNKRRLIEEEYKILTLNDLIQLESRLANGELGSMPGGIKELFVKAAKWRRCNPDLDVFEEFDDDVWEEFCDNCSDDDCDFDYDRVDTMDTEMKVSLLTQ